MELLIRETPGGEPRVLEVGHWDVHSRDGSVDDTSIVTTYHGLRGFTLAVSMSKHTAMRMVNELALAVLECYDREVMELRQGRRRSEVPEAPDPH